MQRQWDALTARLMKQVIRATPKRSWSTALGWLARRPVPARVRARLLTRYAGLFGIDLSEVELPLEEYGSVDAFFTRRLRPGARPVAPGAGVVVSPVDGEVLEHGAITGDRLLQAKGCEYSLAGLLGDEDEAARFVDGTFVTLYLSPRDYHRIHAPVGGLIVRSQHLAGRFYPVNARAVCDVDGLYTVNERLVTFIEGSAGRVAVVKVAALGVGHITATYDEEIHTHARRCAGARTYTPPRPVSKGAEIGVFHLGSTVIVLFQSGRVALEPLARGDHVRCGAPLGRVAAGAGA
ncbi:MAG TPA: archaetidylserine decarboxylase [Polyangia bacterium]|jgi:phosphatidylserine decarboxylase